MQYKILLSLFLLLPVLLDAQLLFPGDLNNDGEANHIDLLPLAIAYGQIGPERPGATFDWIPQETFFWELSLPVTGIDLSFVDADGNGILDSLDLDAIPINYDSTQTGAIPVPEPYLLPEIFEVDELPTLILDINQDEVGAGDTIEVSISLNIPDPTVFPLSNPPTALACLITFDPTYINEEAIFYEPDSSADDLMYVAASVNSVDFGRSPNSGTIEFACGGRGEGALRMSRPIGKFKIVIEDMILLEGDPDFMITDQIMINLNEQLIDLQSQTDGLLVSVAADPEKQVDIEGFPNPTRGVIVICPAEFADPSTISVYNETGQRFNLNFVPVNEMCWQVDLTVLPEGIYWMVQEVGGYTQQITVVKQ